MPIGGVKFANQPGAVKCDISSEGDRYAGWKTLNEFLDYYVPWLKREYLTEGGSYYEGKSVASVCVHYNGGDSWTNAVKSIGNELLIALNK